jgi:hypothetical protein
MRTKLTLDNSTDRIANKLAISGLPLSNMPLPSLPLEWLDAGSWRLPSGKALAEFALQAGFLAPLLFNGKQLGGGRDGRAVPSRSKHCAKGSGQ